MKRFFVCFFPLLHLLISLSFPSVIQAPPATLTLLHSQVCACTEGSLSGYLDLSDNTLNLKYLYLNNALNYTVLHNKATATRWFASAPGMFTINQSIMP